MVQVYTEKTAATLNSNAIVAYPVHVGHMISTETFQRFIIDHRYMFVGLLLLRTTIDEQDKRAGKHGNPYKVQKPVVLLYDALPLSMQKTQET